MPGDRFCERCSHDYLSKAAESPRWTARIEADRDFYDRIESAGFTFPASAQARTIALKADDLLIGRRSPEDRSTPDIDLSGDDNDPAVSRRHARLVRDADGAYAILDLHSSNGTWLNDEPEPIEPDVPVRLTHGDRVHLGAWTTITLTGE
jgi:pSer/pThr/pTyr-binding forkhead associated (FHA) protein